MSHRNHERVPLRREDLHFDLEVKRKNAVSRRSLQEEGSCRRTILGWSKSLSTCISSKTCSSLPLTSFFGMILEHRRSGLGQTDERWDVLEGHISNGRTWRWRFLPCCTYDFAERSYAQSLFRGVVSGTVTERLLDGCTYSFELELLLPSCKSNNELAGFITGREDLLTERRWLRQEVVSDHTHVDGSSNV
jgi:hypothetical protein